MSAAGVPRTADNEHVKNFIEILQANGLNADAQGIDAAAGHIDALRRELSAAIGELADMRRELSALREERKHPIKNMLQKAADGLAEKIKGILSSLSSLKSKFIGFCKNAGETVKNQGIAALNGAVEILDIKHDLQTARETAVETIKESQGKIAKIEAACAEMHGAGRHLKNIVLTMRGKEPVPGIKPNGKLAKLAQAPFRSQIKRLTRSIGRIDKMLEHIGALEKAAELRAERGRPSALKAIKDNLAVSREQRKEAPAKVKTAAEEL